MPATFLHGVEIVELDNGPRPIQTVRSSVIGLVGTAPDADATAFPLNTPVLIVGNQAEAAKLDPDDLGNGTLMDAVDAIFDQTGAMIVVVRVDEGADINETLSNVIGGVDGGTGQYQGVHAFLAAQNQVKVTPKILCAPGYTSQRPSGVASVAVTNPGSNYTWAAVTINGDGTGATAEAVLSGGEITEINVTNKGYGYTTAAVDITGDGDGLAAANATVAAVANPVVAEMSSIAERLRAVIIADGPNTTDADAITYREDWGSKRIYVVDPNSQVWDTVSSSAVDQPSSARVAGLIAKTDSERGFWWSPSNQIINGIVGTGRAVDFALGDPNSRANYLNENEVATIIQQDGYRLWGNRTTSGDAKWAFLSVVRTADMINESLQQAHLWAVDRNITKTYLEDVVEGVNAYLRTLKAKGAILGGKCWADPDLNTPTEIAAGNVYFDFDFTPPTPAEHITFRSRLVNDYFEEVI